MKISYGLPYTGSKNSIAEWVVDQLPSADTLVDAFFGGGAITHCAMLKDKYKHYIANDIRTTPQFFKDCIEGKYHNDTRWISHEDFAASVRDDWFVRLVFSFSNNCNSYAYGKVAEPVKKAIHYAICFGDFSLLCELYASDIVDAFIDSLKDIPLDNVNDRRLAAQSTVRHILKSHSELTRKDFCCASTNGNNLVQSLACLNRIQTLERLNRAQTLEGLSRAELLECYNVDYHNLIIPDNAVVYLDPPYKGAFDYNQGSSKGSSMMNQSLFDAEAFLDWAYEVGQIHPTYISEYNIDDPRFVCINSRSKRMRAAGSGSKNVIEKLYVVNK